MLVLHVACTQSMLVHAIIVCASCCCFILVRASERVRVRVARGGAALGGDALPVVLNDECLEGVRCDAARELR
jgi:hypothetical protein